jgi:hypothetical protein
MITNDALAYQPAVPRFIGFSLCVGYGLVTLLVSFVAADAADVPRSLLPTAVIWSIGAIRATRMGVFVDRRGLTVRNMWRTRRFDWTEITRLSVTDLFLGAPSPASVVGIGTASRHGRFLRPPFPVHVTYQKDSGREVLFDRLREEGTAKSIEVELDRWLDLMIERRGCGVNPFSLNTPQD